jgi:hypothetical protein
MLSGSGWRYYYGVPDDSNHDLLNLLEMRFEIASESESVYFVFAFKFLSSFSCYLHLHRR